MKNRLRAFPEVREDGPQRRVEVYYRALVQIRLSGILGAGGTVDFINLFCSKVREKTNFAPEPD
jgi:hypothetical protein